LPTAAAARLERALGISIAHKELLVQALTHRSFGTPHYERLEFVGDSVLNLLVARLLFDYFPAVDEGELSRIRANLVNQASLHEQALGLGLSDHLRLGDGEARSGGYARPSILADVFEAIVGALYLDSGLQAAHVFVERLFAPVIRTVHVGERAKDAKTALQERLQAQHRALPKYVVIETRGVAHEQTFVVEASTELPLLAARGEGTSKRIAEQAAATTLLGLMQATDTAAATAPRGDRKATKTSKAKGQL
jgi:ribonuclease III